MLMKKIPHKKVNTLKPRKSPHLLSLVQNTAAKNFSISSQSSKSTQKLNFSPSKPIQSSPSTRMLSFKTRITHLGPNSSFSPIFKSSPNPQISNFQKTNRTIKNNQVFLKDVKGKYKQQIKLFSTPKESNTPKNNKDENKKEEQEKVKGEQLSSSGKDTHFIDILSKKQKEELEEKDITKVEYKDPISPYNWTTVFSILFVGALGYAYFEYLKRQKEEKLKSEEKTIGKAMIGGPFTLVDQDGIPTTDAMLRGKYLLIYFGFTFCPDICPIELQKVATIMDLLEKVEGISEIVQPIFISIDPNRDSVAAVREYVKEFHPRLMGLTGTPEQINSVAKKYRVYLSPTHQDQDDEDYLLDHSVILYLIDPRGDFLDFFGKNLNAEEVTDRILKRVFEQHNLFGSKEEKPWYKFW